MNEVLTRERDSRGGGTGVSPLRSSQDHGGRCGAAARGSATAASIGISHSKVALRDAVVEGWLKRTSDPLAAIGDLRDSAARSGCACGSTRCSKLKRDKVTGDPELFSGIARPSSPKAYEVVARHVDHSRGPDCPIILGDGVEERRFPAESTRGPPRRPCSTPLVRFHDPAHAIEWNDPAVDVGFERV